MSRAAFTVILGLGGLACAGRDAQHVEDPDLAPLEPVAVQQEPVLEPDEVIETPDVGIIGKGEPAKGPTQRVEIEDEASPHDQVVVPPKRTKSGSFMSGVKMNPNK